MAAATANITFAKLEWALMLAVLVSEEDEDEEDSFDGRFRSSPWSWNTWKNNDTYTHTLNLHIDCNKLFFPTCCLGTLGSGCLRVVVGVSVSSGCEPASVEVEEVEEEEDDGRHFWNWNYVGVWFPTTTIEIMSVFDFPHNKSFAVISLPLSDRRSQCTLEMFRRENKRNDGGGMKYCTVTVYLCVQQPVGSKLVEWSGFIKKPSIKLNFFLILSGWLKLVKIYVPGSPKKEIPY